MLNRLLLTIRPLTIRPPAAILPAAIIATAVAASIVFTGCATTETMDAPKMPRRFVSTVSSSTGLFLPGKNQPILWDGTLNVTDSAGILGADRLQLITAIVKEEMQAHGYQFAAAGKARFSMKAVLLMGKDADQQQLNALSGVAPELRETGNGQSGALGVYFTDTDTEQVVWKSATELVTRSQLPEEQQLERIRYAVKQMLGGLPDAK